MGGVCCKCYKEPSTETKVEQQLGQKNAPPMKTMQSIPSTSSPATSADSTNGKSATNTRQRLINFYKIHNPQKVNDNDSVEEVLRRYKGREAKLFNDLNRKYNVKNSNNNNQLTPINTNTNTNTNSNDMKQNGDGNTGKSDDECDESSPLNSKKNEIDDIVPVQINTNTNNVNPTNNNNKSPSISNRKISKQALGSDSDNDHHDATHKEADFHPMLATNHSESVPINGTREKKEKQQIKVNNNAIAIDKLPNLNKDLFKISVTKPNKKKAKGTDLFGGTDAKKRNSYNNNHQKSAAVPFGKPLFATSNSNSQSQSRSTSFIQVADLNTMHSFGNDGLPKFSDNIKRSNTLTLHSSHKDKLDKRRQSSLAVRRNQDRRNLPIRINKVWTIFAQYILDQMVEQKEKEHNNNMKDNNASKLNKIDETPEATPEPQAHISPRSDGSDILDEIINRNKDDKNNKKNKNKNKNKGKDQYFEEDIDANNNRKKGHESLEVLQIDPRLFVEAKGRSSASASASTDSRNSDSASNSDSDGMISTNSDHGSGSDSDGSDTIDVYTIELTYSQFNIVLNNNNIEVSPDMSAALVWLLLDVNNMVTDEVRNLGQESDNLHNDPMRERGFHNKQFKLIYKCRIQYSMIDCLMKRIGNGMVTRQDKSLHPKHLTYEKRNYVIWNKIFNHLINVTSFNVEEEYLYGALSHEELSDSGRIISMLASLESHWQHRVQLMEHIDDKLSGGSEMERDLFFASICLGANENNYLYLLRGFACQLTDDRSGVARISVSLLPGIIDSMLVCLDKQMANIFDVELVINPIYDGIFTLVKNRRLKDMADDAYETLIQITDTFADIATTLNDFELMNIIIQILENHSNPKIEKHDKARESCIGGIGFLLYGVEPPKEEQLELMAPDNILPHHSVISTPIGQLSSTNNNDDMKMPDIDAIKNEKNQRCKLSKSMQREYLLQNESFIQSLGNIFKNGVTDKSESARRKSFKLLQRLETEKKGTLLQDLMENKWDYTVQKKYKNWKKLNERKKNSSIKNGRKKKRKKINRKKNILKDQVKKNKKKEQNINIQVTNENK